VKALVLPSPFLPDVAYEPLVASLRGEGLDAVLAPVARPPVAADLVTTWTALAAADTLLVPHSNAGYLAPAVSAGAGGAPVVFVDAALPSPGPVTRLAPPAFRDHLAELADSDGRLPPWTRWWSPADYADVLPGEWFERVDAEAPQVPLAYVDSEVAVPPDWESGACGYLALGPSYVAEWDRAEAAGWPRRRIEGEHLHWLVDPDEVTDAVLDLLSRIR
jgi:hypothetical protein